MLFPIPKVPAQFSFSCDVDSPLVELSHDLPEVVDSESLCHPFAEIDVRCKSRKEYLKQVSPHAGIISTRVLFSQLQVLEGETVQVHDLPAEKSRILQQSLSAHDSVYICLGQALVDIIEEIYASVGNYWNVERLLDLFDDCPVAFSNLVLVLLLCPAVDGEQLAACFLYSLCQLNCLLLGLHASDFAENRNLDVFSQSSDNPLDQFRLFQQKRAIVSFPGNTLRASQVDINGVDLILQHLGCLHHDFRIIPTYLSNNWPILRTRGEVNALVVLSCGHHFGMQHRCICEIDSIFSGEHAEGKLGLVDHRAADQCRILKERQMMVVVLHVKEILLLEYKQGCKHHFFGIGLGLEQREDAQMRAFGLSVKYNLFCQSMYGIFVIFRQMSLLDDKHSYIVCVSVCLFQAKE